ncbi:RagB/SusD family nutrient uptake outer membrane protein [Saccharicrinis sp. FJH62]|uniref:RagB/SusD family nutrient uptake outer membrane protein n=1 Tax=Saccharicrinis sp. FJH62 TaxID=3344657 RepID=UPI0035D489A4
MKIINYIACILTIVLFFGCTDVLNKDNLNVVTDAKIWEDADQANLYINDLYAANMPGMSLGVNSYLSDEFFSSSSTYTSLLYGLLTDQDINDLAFQVLHKDKYKAIRMINVAIEGLQNSSLSDEERNPLIAQARVLRAMRYFEMVKFHGGIPMVLRPQDPFFEKLDVARSKTSVSFDIILQDLNFAKEWLPVEWEQPEDNGRFTSGAVAAYKGRVLLTWASPLFNRNDDQSRWQSAYDANQEAIDLLSQMSVPRDLYPDFSTIFTTDVLDNVESVIFKRYDYDVSPDYTSGWEASVRPPSGGGNGGYAPTWTLVQAFPMANGKRIDEADSGYDPIYYWHNRDPRFYATIAYNGCEWSMTSKENDLQWTYYQNMSENRRSPSTGFYCRKATNPDISEELVSQTSTSWHELRYAEVLMNFAECANEIGKIDEALTEIRRIRERAGIEPGDGTFGIPNTVSKEELRQLIMIERQVEFAFENKRFYDLRRRLMFREDMGNIVKKLNGTQRLGLSITAKSPWDQRVRSGEFRGFFRLDTAVFYGYVDVDENYETYFDVEEKIMEGAVNGEVQSLNYRELYDFYPLKYSVVNSSDSIQQTIGYINGTFDPLAE